MTYPQNCSLNCICILAQLGMELDVVQPQPLGAVRRADEVESPDLFERDDLPRSHLLSRGELQLEGLLQLDRCSLATARLEWRGKKPRRTSGNQIQREGSSLLMFVVGSVCS